MPVLVEADPETTAGLLRGLPHDTRAVTDQDGLHAWLSEHQDEYVVVLGPSMALEDALRASESLRATRPTASTVLVRDEISTEVFSRATAAGAREVIQTGTPIEMSAAVARARELFSALRGSATPAPELGTVVTVWSPKGGVGKTTMAVNLALALAEKGARRVCVVDLDLAFGDVAITMQLVPAHTIEDAIGSEDTIDAALVGGLLTEHPESLMVLAAPARPDVRDRISPTLVGQIIRTLRRTFDYVVIDTAPALDEHTLSALDQTDEIVLVATLDVPTLKNVKVALETLDMLDLAPDHRHLLLNRADEEVGISADRVAGILGMCPEGRVASSVDVAAATNAGRPIVVRAPQHPAAQAILAMAAAVAGRPLGAAVGGRAGSGGGRHGAHVRRLRWKRR